METEWFAEINFALPESREITISLARHKQKKLEIKPSQKQKSRHVLKKKTLKKQVKPPDMSHIRSSTTVDQKAKIPGAQTILEARPIYRINPPPSYPIIARKRGYQGNVVLEVLINKQGKVIDFRVFSSSGYSILDKTAIASVKNWLFEPGMRGPDKIEMWVRVPIRFKLN